MPREISTKEISLLEYLIAQHSKPTVTVLMKLCYLIDLVAVKELGRQLTNFEYIRYYYGPYDRALYDALDLMQKESRIMSEMEYPGIDPLVETVVYKPTVGSESQLEAFEDESEKELIMRVVAELRGTGAKGLKDVAYGTKPMKALGATQGGTEGLNQRLNLSIVRSGS